MGSRSNERCPRLEGWGERIQNAVVYASARKRSNVGAQLKTCASQDAHFGLCAINSADISEEV